MPLYAVPSSDLAGIGLDLMLASPAPDDERELGRRRHCRASPLAARITGLLEGNRKDRVRLNGLWCNSIYFGMELRNKAVIPDVA